MFIRKFRVRNYMVHQDTSIELQPLTVLVGPNGGGKSALFDAMLNFSMLARGKCPETRSFLIALIQMHTRWPGICAWRMTEAFFRRCDCTLLRQVPLVLIHWLTT